MSLTLLDWRRNVAAMHAAVRATHEADPSAALVRFRRAKDLLFREHRDSPIPRNDGGSFDGLRYWAHDPGFRFVGALDPVEPSPATATSISGEDLPLRKIGRVRLPLGELAA